MEAYKISQIANALEMAIAIDTLSDSTRDYLLLCKRHLDAEKETSAALRLMREAWANRASESWLQLNNSLYKTLCGIIELGIAFNENDFAEISKDMHGGYWFGTSANGHHFGEGLYAAACNRNASAAKSYEASFGRIPFILGGKRVFEGFKFEYVGLYCHVTGWTKENDKLRFVGYQNRNQEGVKKLFEMDKREWTKAKKEMKK